jgi:hypothetical protein
MAVYDDAYRFTPPTPTLTFALITGPWWPLARAPMSFDRTVRGDPFGTYAYSATTRESFREQHMHSSSCQDSEIP